MKRKLEYPIHTRFFTYLLEIGFFLFFGIVRLFSSPKGNNRITNIILIEPFQMGDIVSLSVILSPLKLHFPNSNIYIYTKNNNPPIYKTDKRVKEVITSDFPWSTHGQKLGTFKRWIALFRDLQNVRHYNFDIGIDTRGDIRSQIVLNFLRCKEIVGYTNYLNSNVSINGLLLSKKVLPNPLYLHRYDWNTYILSFLNIEINDLFPIRFPSLSFDAKKYITEEKYLMIHVGGGWEYRLWSNEKWIESIKQILKLYPNYKVKLIAGEGERNTLQFLEKKINSEQVQYYITSFDELIYFIKNAELFIGLDSGPMNIAECLGKKSLILFGPGNSNVWHPYGIHSRFIQKIEKFPCNPCLQKKCYFPKDNCMQEIKVIDVINKLNEFSL